MAYDSYSDSSAGPSQTGPDDAAPEEEDAAAENTALLPKSILAGKEFKVGEEVVLKITHIYEDQVEVAYATEKGSEHEESGEYEEEKPDEMSMKA